MGWANCGEDSQGRPIGYAHEATCDEPGCDAVIDRGLDYVCGGMHGRDEHSCEKYFCGNHLFFAGGRRRGLSGRVCRACLAILGEDEDEDSGEEQD